MKRRSVLSLLFLLLVFSLPVHARAETAHAPFFRFDLDSPEAWQRPLPNVRFLTEGAWHLTPIAPEKCLQYGLSPEALPSTAGLDTLNISGSATFSEAQFRQLASDLRSLAGARQIWILDCRLESHALVNGISLSWYGNHNWANMGLSLSEAEAEEARLFASLPGTSITAYAAENNVPSQPQVIQVERVQSEKALVESEGFRYFRLAANDHSWPEEEAIEAFLAFVDELDKTAGADSVWLHFHCQAGKSRTGIFMSIYDMIRNPDLSFEDIMLRQAMTGSSYFPYVNAKSELAQAYALRARRIRQIYDYLQKRHRGESGLSWRSYLAQAE